MGIALFLNSCTHYSAKPISLGKIKTGIEHRELDADILSLASQRVEDADIFAGIDYHLDPGDGISLDEAFVMGIVYNAELKALRQTMEERSGMVISASAISNPKWELKALSGGGDLRGESSIRQDVLSFLNLLKRPARKEIAVAEVDLARLLVTSAERNLYFDLFSLYEQYLYHERFAGQLREWIREYTEQVLHPAEQMIKTGYIPVSDLLEIQKFLDEFEMEFTRIENRKLGIREKIHEKIGFPPYLLFELQHPDAADAEVPFSPEDSRGLADLAVQRHPDLQILLAEYHIAENEYRLAILEQYPDVNLGPAVNLGSMDDFYGLALHMIVPIFYQNQGEIKTSFARRERVRQKVEARLIEMQHEIQNALRQMDYCRGQVNYINNSVLPNEMKRLRAAMVEQRYYPERTFKTAVLFKNRTDSWLRMKDFELRKIDETANLQKSIGVPLISALHILRNREERS